MLVKELIKQLKKMPQNLEVGMSAHDNNDWEIAGWVNSINLFDKTEIKLPDYIAGSDRDWYASQPNKAVVLNA